jgi:hypothetical protein
MKLNALGGAEKPGAREEVESVSFQSPALEEEALVGEVLVGGRVCLTWYGYCCLSISSWTRFRSRLVRKMSWGQVAQLSAYDSLN